MGEAMLRLRQLAARIGGAARVQDVLRALAQRQPDAAAAALRAFDAEVALRTGPPAQLQRARAVILAMQEVLARHGRYFSAEGGSDAIL
jgi:hypothetical protein